MDDSGESSRRVARSLANARMIYGALLVSIVIYGGIAFQIASQAGPVSAKSGTEPVAPADWTLFLIILGVVSGVMTVAVIPLVRRLLLPRRRSATAPSGGGEGAAPGLVASLTGLLRAQVVTWALSESIATFGLMASFLTYQPLYYLGFALLSVANFALYPPRASLWDEVAAATEG